MPLYRSDGQMFCFMHIPKCGGSSMAAFLEGNFGAPAFRDVGHYDVEFAHRWTKTSPQHCTWSSLARLVPQAWVAFSFAIVRDPLARLVSEYNFQSTVQGRIPVGMTLLDWWAEFADLRDMLPFLHDNHLRPQVEFVGPDTHVFRLEDGPDAAIDLVESNVGRTLDHSAFGRENARIVPPPDLFRTEEVSGRDLSEIVDYFAPDFAAFGYEAHPSSRYVTHVPTPELARSGPESMSRIARQRFRRRAWREVVKTAHIPVTPY